jgi:protein-S-isoprenylcysteine O-methyltransferase Ste14
MDAQTKLLSPQVVIQVLIFIVLGPMLPLLISWRWSWIEAWLFAAISILGFVFSRALAARRHPDLLTERARIMQHEDIEPWDKVLAPAVAIGGALILVVAGLDARFDWSTGFGLPLKSLALLIILAGYVLGSYALIENRFFSGVVRLQADRGQHVISSGPYRWLRHPGYSGALLSNLVTPILLDSALAFVPAILAIATLVIRTSLEDKTLIERLEGYRDYASRVRYRLIPGVW